ncbi:CHAP domain-containing protein [Armatimonas sp.]|uniref:CHAP domain-containing protein n=1 Tax=Armatimonas sp. TaxID=1872638 RepID=UPI00286C53FE|nr:CHAP domain-containing protein [Armatimonas sp.]
MHTRLTTFLALMSLGTAMTLMGCGGTSPSDSPTPDPNAVVENALIAPVPQGASTALPDSYPSGTSDPSDAVDGEVTRATKYKDSPNGFKFPNCTWGADVITYGKGWALQFSSKRPRNAINWIDPTVLANAGLSSEPGAGSLMVLRNSSSGHVAYVWEVVGTSSSGNTVISVLHTNWPYGERISDALYRTYFVISANRRSATPAYSVNGKVSYGKTVPLAGFLYRR